MGIKGNVGNWIHSFLTDRYQTVIVDGCESVPCKVISGVPQGSVLGPLLFLILIGDIDEKVADSFVSSFADDTRVGKGINSLNDSEALQNDINHVYRWADTNNMMFNFDKFEALRYGEDHQLKTMFNYTTPDGKTIKDVEHAKDLGVQMSADGSFNHHIDKVCEGATQLVGWALRTFRFQKWTTAVSSGILRKRV
jgi:ribonuclease P/MRP protein subunit RPP40